MTVGETDPSEIYGGANAPAAPGQQVTFDRRELNRILASKIEPIYEDARPGEIQRIYLDATRAKQVLGWSPQISFGDGLTRVVEWSRQHPLPGKA